MMSDGSKLSNQQVWQPTLSFFRSGNSEFLNPFSNQREEIKWSFQKAGSTLLPLTFTSCGMTALGITSHGFGDHILLKNSMIQAFAEGWERLWMQYLSKNHFSDFPFVKSSNGFAAAKTNETALLHSRRELIERALMKKAWEEQEGWFPYRLKGFLSRTLDMFLNSKGWKTSYFLITDNNYGKVLVGYGRHNSNGIIFDSLYFGKGRSPQFTETKLIRSLLRCLLRNYSGNRKVQTELPQAGRPEDHGIFYGNPKHAVAFDFLNFQDSQNRKSDLPNSSHIVSKLVFPVSHFPAVAVSHNEAWEPMKWGKESIRGKNRWPHPLA